MSFVKGLQCRECGQEYPSSPLHVCETCFGPLEIRYDYEGIKKSISREKIAARERNLWRYRELLPIDGEPQRRFVFGIYPAGAGAPAGRSFGRERTLLEGRLGESSDASPTKTASSPWRSPKRSSSASIRFPARPPATWLIRWPPTPPRPGLIAMCLSPMASNKAKSSAPPFTGPTPSPSKAITTTSIGCAARSATNTAGRSLTSICGHTIPEGAKTHGFEVVGATGLEAAAAYRRRIGRRHDPAQARQGLSRK